MIAPVLKVTWVQLVLKQSIELAQLIFQVQEEQTENLGNFIAIMRSFGAHPHIRFVVD